MQYLQNGEAASFVMLSQNRTPVLQYMTFLLTIVPPDGNIEFMNNFSHVNLQSHDHGFPAKFLENNRISACLLPFF